MIVLVEEAERGGARLLDAAQAGAEPVDSIDPTRPAARVDTAAGEPLPGDVAIALDRAAIAVAAELVGVCDRALAMTLDYVKDRKQFGTPVGAFQAVQHKVAQMLLDTERARSTTAYAAWSADAEPERFAEAASMAAATTADASRAVCDSAVQAHGGIGFTWEADVHWLLKRAHVDVALLGGAGHHRAALARLVGGRLSATA